MRFNTKLIHGNLKLDETGATNTPLYLSNAYDHSTAEKIEGIMKGTSPGYAYTRIANPTVTSFERRIAALEGGLLATAAASGMSAIYMAVLNVVESGDEILAASGLYGGTYTLLRNLKTFGIKVTFIDDIDEEKIKAAVSAKTKLLFAETIGNPKLDVLDIEAISKVCKEHNIVLMIDSTVTTPYLIRPIEFGADVVIHSTSKYINGTSNSIGGIIIDGGSDKYKDEKFQNFKEYRRFGKMAYTAKLKNTIGRDIGASLAPLNAFLNLTGVETLALRMREHCKNALTVAQYLSKHNKVSSVNYPGLPGSSGYELAQKYYGDRAGGILTFRLGSKEKAFKFINNLTLIMNLPNIGDAKTIAIHPSSTICAHNTEDEKLQMGVYDDLLRLSVGIEDVKDIIEDIENSLKTIE